MTVKTPRGESDKLSRSASVVSRFLSLDQIYSAHELNAYLQELSVGQPTTPDSRPDVIVLCASAILAIAEAVFEWASQFTKNSGTRQEASRVVLVLCGAIGPSTSFLYEAVKANARYCEIVNDIQCEPEAQVLKAIAERFYGLKVGGGGYSPCQGRSQGNLQILVEDGSTNFSANASETRRVLEDHGVYHPRSITVVPDPNMSRQTVAAFSRVYDDKGPGLAVSSWPALKPNSSIDLNRYENSSKSTGFSRQGGEKELWSMDRFLDLMLGELPGSAGSGYKPRKIPSEVEDAWSTVLDGCSFVPPDYYAQKLSY